MNGREICGDVVFVIFEEIIFFDIFIQLFCYHFIAAFVYMTVISKNFSVIMRTVEYVIDIKKRYTAIAIF